MIVQDLTLDFRAHLIGAIEMQTSKFILLYVVVVVSTMSSWSAFATNQTVNRKDVPAPILCYLLVPEIDKEINVGAGVELCAGSTDAEKTLKCYEQAWTTLKLTRGQAVRLCSAGMGQMKQ
jgi:hypothetical protein